MTAEASSTSTVKKPETKILRRIDFLLLAVSLLLAVPSRTERRITCARTGFRIEIPATYVIGSQFGSDGSKRGRRSVEVSTLPSTDVEAYDTTVRGIARGRRDLSWFKLRSRKAARSFASKSVIRRKTQGPLGPGGSTTTRDVL